MSEPITLNEISKAITSAEHADMSFNMDRYMIRLNWRAYCHCMDEDKYLTAFDRNRQTLLGLAFEVTGDDPRDTSHFEVVRK